MHIVPFNFFLRQFILGQRQLATRTAAARRGIINSRYGSIIVIGMIIVIDMVVISGGGDAAMLLMNLLTISCWNWTTGQLEV